jgi:hypothetical protein
MIPPPAEEIPPDAVRVSSNGTVTVIFPWAISLATKWRAGPVDGLRISEDVASAAVLPNYPYLAGIRTFTVTAEQPGTYLFPAWWIMTGEENTVLGRAPEFSQILVFSAAAENSAAVVAYLNGETYTRETDMAVPRNFLPLKTNGTAQIVLPWFSSLGMEWSTEATEGLHVTESWHVNPLPPYGKNRGNYVCTITANEPGVYLFHTSYLWYGKDAPFAEYSAILLVSDTSGVSGITVEYQDGGEYLLTPELLDITFQEMLVTPSAPSPPSPQTATPNPVS